MRHKDPSAADRIWREKANSDFSFLGGLIVLVLIAAPLILL